MPNQQRRGCRVSSIITVLVVIRIAVLKFVRFSVLVGEESEDVSADKAEESFVHEHCEYGARSSAGVVDCSQHQRNRRAITLNLRDSGE